MMAGMIPLILIGLLRGVRTQRSLVFENLALRLSLLFNHRGCSWGTMSGWRSSAPLLTQGGH
jgi:hypothetical protein